MVLEIVDEEHIPQHPAIVAGAAQVVEHPPDRPAAHKRRHLPEHQDGDHVGRPDADESVQDSPEVEPHEALGLLELLQHAHGDQEATDPEESVDCEVGCGDDGGHAGGGQDVERLGPVFDVHEAEPGVVAEDDPEDGEHPCPVEEQKVVVVHMLRDAHDLQQVVVDAKRLQHPHPHALALRYLPHNRPQHSQQHQEHQQPDGQIVGPVELRLGLHRVVELEADEGHEAGVGGLLVGLVEALLHQRCVFVRGELLATGDGCAETHALQCTGQSVDHLHGEEDVLVAVELTVVIVAQVVEELAGVCVDDRAEALRIVDPAGYDLLAVLPLRADEQQHEQQ